MGHIFKSFLQWQHQQGEVEWSGPLFWTPGLAIWKLLDFRKLTECPNLDFLIYNKRIRNNYLVGLLWGLSENMKALCKLCDTQIYGAFVSHVSRGNIHFMEEFALFSLRVKVLRYDAVDCADTSVCNSLEHFLFSFIYKEQLWNWRLCGVESLFQIRVPRIRRSHKTIWTWK